MGMPTTASGYDLSWFNLIHRAKKTFDTRGSGGFDLAMPDRKKAENLRFTFYKFRKALKNDAQKHMDSAIRKERYALYQVAEYMRLRTVEIEPGKFVIRVVNTKVDDFGGSSVLGDALFDLEASEAVEREGKEAEARELASSEDNPLEARPSEEDGGQSIRDLFK